MNHNQFPRGTVAEHSPLDSVDTARDIVHTLGVNGEAVELSPEQRSVETAFTVDDAIEQGVKEENPDLAGPDLAKEIDGRVADLVRDSRDPEVPREGRVEAAVVGIVDETRRPGGEVADVLAEDPETFTEAVEVSLEGGMSPETLEKVVAGVTAREEIKAWVEEDGATKEGLLSPFGPGTNPDTGNFDVRFMPRSGDAEQNQIHNKIRNDTTLTVMEGIRSGRDKVTRQLGEVELLPDRVYRGTDAEEVRNLLIEGKLMSRSLDDEYEEAEEGSNNNKGIDWYLGGASQRYGEVFLEAPARPDYVGPKRDNGTRLASGGYVRHFHSSGRNHPIPEQEVTIIAKKIDSNEYERMSPREFIASLDAEQPTENIQQKTTSARGDMAGKEMLAYPAADVLAEDPETFTEAVEVSLEGGMSPETLEKVVAGVTAREGVAEDSPKDSHSTPASEFGGVPEFIVSPEQVKADTMRRIDIPMELRKGQEVADPQASHRGLL